MGNVVAISSLLIQNITKHEQPLQYAVVDKSKKKSRKDDKQQNVSAISWNYCISLIF